MDPKEENYVPGDLVYKTALWASCYPGWKVSRGIVMLAKKSFVSDESLSTSDRIPYRSRYGKQDKYPSFEILISTPEGNYSVSQFGFNKDPEKEEKK